MISAKFVSLLWFDRTRKLKVFKGNLFGFCCKMQNDRTPPGSGILQFSTTRIMWLEELTPHPQLPLDF